jgi:hypothetical protein
MGRNALATNGTRSADQLGDWIERDMRMSHVYQPGVLRALLDARGIATVAFASPSSMCGQRSLSRRLAKRARCPQSVPEVDSVAETLRPAPDG